MGHAGFFGIDGGGTKSRIRIIDATGNTLAQGIGGSTNIYSVSSQTVFDNLKTLLEAAVNQTTDMQLAGGCIGSAGLSRDPEKKLFSSFFQQLIPNVPVKLCSDGEILLCGGLLANEGYCLIGGTGSLALGREKEGTIHRAGGYGYLLGDEGSAWWIAHEALSRSLRSAERRDLPTSMLSALLEACALKDPSELIEYVHHIAGKADIARLAPIVTTFALQGDKLANDILEKGTEELVKLVESVQNESIGNHELVLAGGVLEHDQVVLRLLKQRLALRLPHLEIIKAKGTALDGACLLSRTPC
ncbi:MAG: BadF/BadG/BcrA/BcrD ATPase family protein [Sphaerochaetaceae bacterium]